MNSLWQVAQLSQHLCLEVLFVSLGSDSGKSSNVQNQERSRLCVLPPVMKTSTSVSLAPFWRSQNLSGSFSLPPSEGERGRSLTQSEKLQYHNRNKSVHETPQRDRLGREIGVALITRWRPVGTDWVRVSRRCRVAAQIAWCDKSSEDVIEMMVSDGIFSILCLCRRAETDGKQMLRRFVLAQ